MQDQENGRNAAGACTNDEWFEKIALIGDERGYFERLGTGHAALFVDEGPRLLVSFETVASIRNGSPEQLPLGYRVAQEHGWSHLCLIAEGETWFRDPAVYGYFDRLVDDAFFEDFDHVAFYGAGMCGYAASAFCVTAPGATVVAIQPQATLDPRVTEWDDRFSTHRRIDFTNRYGYAPEMIDGAGEVFILYDPKETADAMHAALFTKPFVSKLRCPHLGPYVELSLQQMEVLSPLLAHAGAGTLTAEIFHRLYRARRIHGGYLRALLSRLQDDDRPLLSTYVCHSVLSRMSAPRIRKRLEQAEAELAARKAAATPALPSTPHSRPKLASSSL